MANEQIEGDPGMTLEDVAECWGLSRQRAHVLVRSLEPQRRGRKGRGTGTRYRRSDLAALALQKIQDARQEQAKWEERLRKLGEQPVKTRREEAGE